MDQVTTTMGPVTMVQGIMGTIVMGTIQHTIVTMGLIMGTMGQATMQTMGDRSNWEATLPLDSIMLCTMLSRDP